MKFSKNLFYAYLSASTVYAFTPPLTEIRKWPRQNGQSEAGASHLTPRPTGTTPSSLFAGNDAQPFFMDDMEPEGEIAKEPKRKTVPDGGSKAEPIIAKIVDETASEAGKEVGDAAILAGEKIGGAIVEEFIVSVTVH